MNSGSEGFESVTVAAAFPVFWIRRPWLVALVPAGVVANDTAAGKTIVAPVGVAVAGTVTVRCAGSFVNRFTEPTSCEPAGTEPGTCAVTVNVPVVPGAIDCMSGETKNTAPVVVVFTASGADPWFWIENVWVPTLPQVTAPTSTPAGKSPDAVPASAVGAASFAASCTPASVGVDVVASALDPASATGIFENESSPPPHAERRSAQTIAAAARALGHGRTNAFEAPRSLAGGLRIICLSLALRSSTPAPPSKRCDARSSGWQARATIAQRGNRCNVARHLVAQSHEPITMPPLTESGQAESRGDREGRNQLFIPRTRRDIYR